MRNERIGSRRAKQGASESTNDLRSLFEKSLAALAGCQESTEEQKFHSPIVRRSASPAVAVSDLVNSNKQALASAAAALSALWKTSGPPNQVQKVRSS